MTPKLDSFLNVGHNLLAIYNATHYQENKVDALESEGLYKYLLPNITFLYQNHHVNFWPQRKVRTFISSFLLQEDPIPYVQAALNYTHYLFHQHQNQLMEIHLPAFKEALGKKKISLEVDKVALKNTHERIQDFYLHTHYFFKAVYENQNERLKQIFFKHFCSGCFNHIKEVEHNYAIISLQALLDEEIPLKELIDISYTQLEIENLLTNVIINQFIRKSTAKKIPIDLFHTALKTIIIYGHEFPDGVNLMLKRIPCLATLESHLFDLNQDLFNQVDTDFLRWRDALTEESPLVTEFYEDEIVSKYCFVLGNQIGKKAKANGIDKNIYFEIKNCTKNGFECNEFKNCILWLSINKAIPGVRLKQRKRCTTIFPVCIDFIDSEGRFALVRKLAPLPLRPMKDNPLATKFYETISGWIKFLIENSLTPNRLNVNTFMLEPLEDQGFTLTSIRLVKDLPNFSYVPLEQFAYDLSKGDNLIYQFIMKKSTLATIDDALYIKNSVVNTFNPTFDPIREAIGKSFKDKSIPLFVKSTQKKITELKDECLKLLEINKIYITNEEMQKIILEKYQEKGCVAMLWPSIQSEILDFYKHRVSLNNQ
jgi:hypothetical protein